MSAFIVENQTINRVVTYLRYNRDGFSRVSESLRELNYDINADDFSDKLGSAMSQLNDLAIAERYGASEVEQMRVEAYTFRPENGDHIQAAKALTCWLYQCAEGSVPKSRLYQAMQDFENLLCRRIVSELPEYEAAAWG